MKLEETVWHKNSEPLVKTKYFYVWKDKYPVTEGHLLFVPKEEDWHHRGFSSKGDPKYEIWTQRKQ